MRGIVESRLQEGWTEEQIADSFVESYGPRVLLEPPASGISLMVWVVPPAAVVLAGGLLFLALRDAVESPRTRASGSPRAHRR